MKKTRRLVIALACLASTVSGCATSLTTSDPGLPDGAASPATTAPASLPANAFAPSTPHDFGSQGP